MKSNPLSTDKSALHKSHKQKYEAADASDDSSAIVQVRKDFADALRRTNPSRSKKRSLDEETELDDEALGLISCMKEAAIQDSRNISNQEQAICKISMLTEVVGKLSRRDFIEYLLDNRVLDGVRMWLEPYEDGTLPNVEVRKKLLQVLQEMPIEKEHLKESGLGKIVMYLYKSPDETKENKKLAYKLIDLSRVIQSGAVSENRFPFIIPKSKQDHVDSESVSSGEFRHRESANLQKLHPYKTLLTTMEKLKPKKIKR